LRLMLEVVEMCRGKEADDDDNFNNFNKQAVESQCAR
jgi:hypothetical protein